MHVSIRRKLGCVFNTFAVYSEDAVREGRDRGERFFRLLPVRCVADARHHQRLDGAVAVLLRGMHLRQSSR